jgi:Trk K+ transport system NAD-binding subunit
MRGVGDGRIVIVGCDALALRVCAELSGSGRRPVVVLWHEEDDLETRVGKCGGSFVRRTGDERESLLAAGILEASVVIAVTEDDDLNLKVALSARDENPGIRIVLRQFNRTLGRKIEENLTNSAVISLSSHAAATYAAAAMDRTCYRGVQFPDIDGPLAGFFELTAGAAGIAGVAARDVRVRLGRLLLAVDGEVRYDGARVLSRDDHVTLFGPVLPRRSAPHRRTVVPERELRRAARVLRQLDPVARGALVLALLIFTCGAAYFARALRLDTLTAAYFAVTTMTTTGYGDVSPRDAGAGGLIAAMCLMLGGLVLSGIFIAMLSAMFTQARYDAVQGLRRLSESGHVIVCGAGNVGSRVLEFLVRLGCNVVVVEPNPRPEIVESSRDRRYRLLTGDASRDATLDLCNIEEAVAVVAVTQSDTLNLEVALGARARNKTVPVVLRVQAETFERSLRAHFGFRLTFGTATLAAPAIAGVALSASARGCVGIGSGAYDIAELELTQSVAAADLPGNIALATWRGGAIHLLERFEDARPHERVMYLLPQGAARAGVRSSNEFVM